MEGVLGVWGGAEAIACCLGGASASLAIVKFISSKFMQYRSQCGEVWSSAQSTNLSN